MLWSGFILKITRGCDLFSVGIFRVPRNCPNVNGAHESSMATSGRIWITVSSGTSSTFPYVNQNMKRNRTSFLCSLKQAMNVHWQSSTVTIACSSHPTVFQIQPVRLPPQRWIFGKAFSFHPACKKNNQPRLFSFISHCCCIYSWNRAFICLLYTWTASMCHDSYIIGSDQKKGNEWIIERISKSVPYPVFI